jgi:hypothetical protein
MTIAPHAADEPDARRQLQALPHDCGETAFSASPTVQGGRGALRLVYAGPCPRCARPRVVTFRLADPTSVVVPPPAPAPLPVRRRAAPPSSSFVARGGPEERDLYGGGPARRTECPACRGARVVGVVHGDYTASTEVCDWCQGTGSVDA